MQCYSFTIGDPTKRTISARLIAVSALSYPCADHPQPGVAIPVLCLRRSPRRQKSQGELNEVASAAIRSANCPSRSPQAWATAAGSSALMGLRNSAALRFAPGASPEGAIIQLARIEACEATMLKSKISTLTPNAPLGLG